MFTDVSSFIINSYFCNKLNNSTTEIEYVFDIPQDHLQTITHFSVVNVNLPNTFTQLDEQDMLELVEGLQSATIAYTAGTYKTKANAMLDFQNKLNQISPNQFTYTVTDNNAILDDNALKITCSDAIIQKQIIFKDKYLRYIYGLNKTNNFVSSLSGYSMNLNPISSIFIHSNICSSYNTSGLNVSDIIASVDVKSCGTTVQYDMYHNMKQFTGQKNAKFYLSDFDNYYLDISNNDWIMTINLYRYQELWLDRLNHFISLAAQSFEQKEEQREEQDAIEFNNIHILSHFFREKDGVIYPIKRTRSYGSLNYY